MFAKNAAIIILLIISISNIASANPCPTNAYDCINCAGTACTSNCLPGQGKLESDGSRTAYEYPLEDASKCKCYCPWRPPTQTSPPQTAAPVRTQSTTTTVYEQPWVSGDGNSKCETNIGENCANSNDCRCLEGQKCDPKHEKAKPNGCVSPWDFSECAPNAKNIGNLCVCDKGFIKSPDGKACVKDVKEDCSNGLDDDLDGAIDCVDFEDCYEDESCKEICDNKVDDNLNGLIDCEDQEFCSKDPSCALTVTADIIDGDWNPIKNAKVLLQMRYEGGGRVGNIESKTDDKGRVAFEIKDIESLIGKPIPGTSKKLVAFLNIHLVDADNRFEIIYDKGKWNTVFTIHTKTYPLPLNRHLIISLRADDPEIEKYTGNANNNPEVLWGASKIYSDTERVFSFTQKKLGYGFNGAGNSLPLKVFIYSDEVDTAMYSAQTRGGGIFISPRDSRHDEMQAPENVIWHEFFHFTMYNKYNGWAPYGTLGDNHEGFKNGNTGDSFEEGFAEFWPNIVSSELDSDTKHLYGGIWNVELNYNPWMKYGTVEDIAVATLFWDLVDEKEDKGDRLELPYRELWDLLMSKSFKSMEEVHDALITKWPKEKKQIDDVFITHGFFKDKQMGNQVYDEGEPFWDTLYKNRKYDKGEIYIDIGTPSNMARPYQIFDPGDDVVGTASNWERPNRKNRPKTPGSFVELVVKSNGKKVDDGIYKVNYRSDLEGLEYTALSFKDPETDLVYVELPPDEYMFDMELSVDNYLKSQRLKISSDDFYSNGLSENPMKSATLEVGEKIAGYCIQDRDCTKDQRCEENRCYVEIPENEEGADVLCFLGIVSLPVLVIAAASIASLAGIFFMLLKRRNR